ncbi:hypothetical protein J2Y91_004500 [Erwinia aphidicola]|nr:hypothetical protein [Erwinia aphidicola]
MFPIPSMRLRMKATTSVLESSNGKGRRDAAQPPCT